MKEFHVFISDEAYEKLFAAQTRENVCNSELVEMLILDCLGDE